MLETTITPQVDKAKGQEASAHASSKLDQTSLNLSPVQYVWWCVRTLMTQDIGYVLSHRPKASKKETSDSRTFDVSSKRDQTSFNYSPIQYVWWCVRTLMTQDIGYVLSHRPEASGDASYHLTGNTFRSL